MDVILTKKPYEVSFTGNPMPFIFTLTPYGDLQRSENYKLQVNILIEDVPGTGSYTNVFSQIFFPDYTGVIQMDVSTIIDAYLNYYTPKITLDKPLVCQNHRKKYKLSYQLQNDDDLVTNLFTTSVFYGIKGGMSYEQWNPVQFFEQNIVSNKQPLQFAPEGEKVSLTQPLFFAWLYPYDDKKVQTLTYTFYFDNGTSAVYPHPKTIKANKWAVSIAPAGLSQINYTVPAGRMIVYYTIHINNEDGIQIVAPFTYTIDYRSFYNSFLLLYRNSLGGLTSVRLRGQVDAEADYAYQQASRISTASYFSNQILLPQLTQETNTETEKFTGDTGFISKKALNNLRDLFLSKQIFEVNENNKLLPCALTGSNVKLYSNKSSLFSVQVQWQHAYSNEFFTPAGTVPVNNTCPAVDIFNVVQVNKNTLQIVWSLQTPYDRINVTIDNGISVKTYTYTGNSGSLLQPFTNPATTAPVNITVTGQTLCDEDASPVVAGPVTTLIVSVKPNSKPVAVDDTFAINGGFNTPVDLGGNVLDNDYDPDGDAIEVNPDSGYTNKSGFFTLHADGTVTYQPPNSTFTGQDYFQYRVHEVSDPTSVSDYAKVYVNIGGSNFVKAFVRLKKRNEVSTSNSHQTTFSGDYYLEFYSDVAGTKKLDVTNLGIIVNVHKLEILGATENPADLTFTATGTEMRIYTGFFQIIDWDDPFNDYTYKMELQPGTGYTAIP